MINDKEDKMLNELRLDFKFRMMEKIIKQFFTESLEAVLLKQKDIEGRITLSTIADVAKRFKVPKATIHNWINRGLIKGVKIGKNRYFSEEEIGEIIYFLRKDTL